LNLSLRIQSLLEKDATKDDVKALLVNNTDRLGFAPPLDFDNIYAEDVFYHAVQKERLDILPWMLERQNFVNWNTLHLAVVYENLTLLKKLEDEIPRLGYVSDQNEKTPLHLAFHKYNAQIAQFLLEKECWKYYEGSDRDCLGHMAVEAIVWDYRKSRMSEWSKLIEGLYEELGMVPETLNSEGETALDLAQKWDIFDIRVKYPLMGRR
jgi:ankyrin repeat protein